MPSLESMRDLEKYATPAPWKYDSGNSEVEGPYPERFPICRVDWCSRQPEGQEPNPVEDMADAELIAAMRNLFPLFLDFLEAWDSFDMITARADPEVARSRQAIEEAKI